MKKYRAEIGGRTYFYRTQIREMGFRFDPKKKKWTEELNKDEIPAAKDFCARNGLQLKVYDPKQKRSYNYRKIFFEYNMGLFQKGKYYQCVYCGRFIPRSAVTVDHLYPVSAAERSAKIRKKMRIAGIKNVNELENLVPACASCNSKKGAKTGWWVIRGELGKHWWYWMIRWGCVAALIFMGVFIAVG